MDHRTSVKLPSHSTTKSHLRNPIAVSENCIHFEDVSFVCKFYEYHQQKAVSLALTNSSITHRIEGSLSHFKCYLKTGWASCFISNSFRRTQCVCKLGKKKQVSFDCTIKP